MQLTDRMIADEISSVYAVRKMNHVNTGTIFSGILFKTAAVEAQAGWVYVVSGADAFGRDGHNQDNDGHSGGNKDSGEPGDGEWDDENRDGSGRNDANQAGEWRLIPGALYIFPGPVSEEAQRKAEESARAGFIILDQAADPGEVMNVLTMMQRRLEHWDNELYEMRSRGSLQDMLNISLEVFHNPLMILNADMSLHAQAGMKSEEESRTGSDMDMIAAIIRDDSYRTNLDQIHCYWGPEYITGIRSLGCNIRIHGETRFILILVQRGEGIREEDQDLLEILAAHVGFILRSREHHEEDASLHKVLIRILSDRMLDYMVASERLEALGWGRGDDYQCLVYQLTYVDRRTIPSSSITRYMEEQYPCCSSFVFHGDIVTFFNLSKSDLSAEGILKQLKPFIRDSYLKAAFSRIVNGHMNLRRQYVQAMLAMDVGSRKDPYRWIHYFDRIALDHILEQITRRLPMDMVAHEGVLRLRDYDAEHGTEYIKTLRVYLDNHQNAVQSARDLFIHRSTFLYRIEKIREIADVDMSDPDEMLYCSISLRLLERQGQEETGPAPAAGTGQTGQGGTEHGVEAEKTTARHSPD